MARRRSRPLSENVRRELGMCSGCGEDLWVPYNRVNAANYCDRCSEERESERREQYNEIKRIARREAPERRTGEFLMVKDVEGGWGYETRLEKGEIKVLARERSIAEGTLFQRGQEQWIVKGGDFIKV